MFAQKKLALAKRELQEVILTSKGDLFLVPSVLLCTINNIYFLGHKYKRQITRKIWRKQARKSVNLKKINITK